MEVDDQQHIIEIQVDTIVGMGTGGGQLLIDGKVVDAWGSNLVSVLPAKVEFEIAGKNGVIRRKGTLYQSAELFFDGKEVKRVR